MRGIVVGVDRFSVRDLAQKGNGRVAILAEQILELRDGFCVRRIHLVWVGAGALGYDRSCRSVGKAVVGLGACVFNSVIGQTLDPNNVFVGLASCCRHPIGDILLVGCELGRRWDGRVVERWGWNGCVICSG